MEQGSVVTNTKGIAVLRCLFVGSSLMGQMDLPLPDPLPRVKPGYCSPSIVPQYHGRCVEDHEEK